MTGPILVAGASGPLGRAVMAELAASDRAAVGASRSGDAGSFTLDVTDGAAARAALAELGPSAVIYLARPDLDGAADLETAIDEDISALRVFLEECVRARVKRLVFASSSAVYGTASATPLREDGDASATAPYARLKLAAEQTLEGFRADTGLTTLALRIFNVYGPGFSHSLVNRLALDMEPGMYMTDNFVRDYVHSSDVARAFRLAVDADTLATGVVNVGTGIGTGNLALLTLYSGRPYLAVDASDVRSFSVADTSLASRLLGFTHTVGLSDVVLYPDYLR